TPATVESVAVSLFKSAAVSGLIVSLAAIAGSIAVIGIPVIAMPIHIWITVFPVVFQALFLAIAVSPLPALLRGLIGAGVLRIGITRIGVPGIIRVAIGIASRVASSISRSLVRGAIPSLVPFTVSLLVVAFVP